ASQAAFAGLAEMLGLTIRHPLVWARAVEACFSSDDEPRGIRMEGFGDDFLADVRSIRIRRVNKVDAEFDGATQDANGFLAVLGLAPHTRAGDAHGSKP